MKKISLSLMLVLLAACTQHGDLREWMDNERAQAEKVPVEKEKIAPVKDVAYNPPVFAGLHAFDPSRLTIARQAGQGENAPDFNRPKEILEGFGLDKIQYVGSMKKGGKWLAFVRVEGHVYTVRKGNYLGSDYGQVVSIDPNKIVLSETIENTSGEWIHRDAEIKLVTK